MTELLVREALPEDADRTPGTPSSEDQFVPEPGGKNIRMARAIRTAGLALAVAAIAAAGVASAMADSGGDQAAQPPSTEPPATAVAVRATPGPAQAAAAPETRAEARPPTSAPAILPDVDDDDAGRTPEAIQRAAVAEAAIELDRAAGWQQRMGETALARLAYPWRAIGYRVSFLPARAGYLGMTFPERRLIEMYVREDATVDELARNVAHELGHAVDLTRSTDESRLLYRQVRGIEPTGGWLACRGCTDLSTPAGDFAETFSYFLMDGAFPSRSKLGGGSPSADQLQQLAPLFAAA